MKKTLLSLFFALTLLLGIAPLAGATTMVVFNPDWENFYYNNQCVGTCEHASGTCPANRLSYYCEAWTGNEQSGWIEEATWDASNIYASAYSYRFRAYAPWYLQYPTTNAVYWKGDPSIGYSLGSVDQYTAYGYVTVVNYDDSQSWMYDFAELSDWTGETRQTHRVYADGVDWTW